MRVEYQGGGKEFRQQFPRVEIGGMYFYLNKPVEIPNDFNYFTGDGKDLFESYGVKILQGRRVPGTMVKEGLAISDCVEAKIIKAKQKEDDSSDSKEAKSVSDSS